MWLATYIRPGRIYMFLFKILKFLVRPKALFMRPCRNSRVIYEASGLIIGLIYVARVSFLFCHCVVFVVGFVVGRLFSLVPSSFFSEGALSACSALSAFSCSVLSALTGPRSEQPSVPIHDPTCVQLSKRLREQACPLCRAGRCL